jgi:hypothetical protein
MNISKYQRELKGQVHILSEAKLLRNNNIQKQNKGVHLSLKVVVASSSSQG